MKRLKTILASATVLLTTISVTAQVNILNPSAFKKVKDAGGTTYVVMQNPNAPEVEGYKQIIKDYWKISPAEIISVADLDKYKSKGGAFLFLETETPTPTTQNDGYAKKYAYNLTLFAGKNLGNSSLMMDLSNYVARIGLLATEQGAMKLYQSNQSYVTLHVSDFNFDGAGNLWSWGTGIFKNYILAIQSAIEKGDKISTGDIANKTALTNLKTGLLIVPDYEGLVSSKADKTFKDYPYKYKVVDMATANSKIFSTEKPFYYLLFFKSSIAQKHVTIWDSQTGEIIYLDNSTSPGGPSSLLNASDIKKLLTTIGQ